MLPLLTDRSGLSFATALALVLILPACGAGRGEPGDLVIRDVTVISPERAAPLEHAYVRIRDGRITDVDTRPLRAAHEIDGAGRFLVPGLIDSHVHLGDIPGMLPAHEAQNPAIASAARAQQPRSLLYYGFTTVIDLIGEPERIDEWNRLEVRPDAHFCGGAPIANGYPMIYVPEDERFRTARYFLYDERQRDRLPADIDPERHTPQAVVERMAADGAICVKTFHEPGFGAMRDLPTPTLDMVRELAGAARVAGLPLLLHANSRQSQAFAVEAGVDIIAHGMWNGLDHEEEPLGEDVQALLQSIARAGIAYQPTFQVLHGELDLLDGDDFLDDPMLAHAYPAALIEWYRTPDGGWFRDQLRANFRGYDAAVIYGGLLRRLDSVFAALAAEDAVLLFGSDTPSAPTWANPPGLNALLEMRRWIDAGVGEARLFRALTLDNARAFGLDDAIGTVEPGRIAHLLLLRANPLDSVDAYDTIETVILAGRPIERDSLSARHAAVR